GTQTNKQPTAAPRGGIYITFATTPLLAIQSQDKGTERTGFPVAKITANTVLSPLGRALTLLAKGLVSVSENEFTSRGAEPGVGLRGAAVLIFNLGLTYEIAEFTGFSTMALNQPKTDATANTTAVGGEILFTDNQVLLAPPVQRERIVFSSVELLS